MTSNADIAEPKSFRTGRRSEEDDRSGDGGRRRCGDGKTFTIILVVVL